VAVRLQAVSSFYRYQHFNGVQVASRLYERVFSGRRPYRPMLEHLARRRGHEQRVVRVARTRPRTPPTLTPAQVMLILDSCARWDEHARDWDGSVRDRLLWALLAETGMRLGEALAVKHCDWHTGLGDTPFVEVVARQDHHTGCGSRTAATGGSTSLTSSTASTASTCGGCATPAPMWWSAIWTAGRCS
jgi:site-specific recombinase XerD